MNYHKYTPEKRNVSKPMSEQMKEYALEWLQQPAGEEDKHESD